MTKEKFIETVNSYFDKTRKTRTDNRAAFLAYANYMKSDFKSFFEFIRAKKLPMFGYGSLPSLQGAARYHYCNIRQLTSEKDIMKYADCLVEPQQLTFNFTPPPEEKDTDLQKELQQVSVGLAELLIELQKQTDILNRLLEVKQHE